MALELVPRLREDREEIHVYYSLELPGSRMASARIGAAESTQALALEIGRHS
jgi:hypothetical protein